MLIAITSEGPTLEAKVDQRFGRCPYFLVVDTNDLNFEAISNSNAMLTGGAGIQSAQMLAEKGVTHVLTGACGPNAYQTLSAAGINIVTGCTGNVRDVISEFQKGAVSTTNGPTVFSPRDVGKTFSEQTGPGMNAARRPGARGGMGMGRGMGRGMGMGAGVGYQPPTNSRDLEENSENELELLKKQMQQIGERIQQLEKEKDRRRK